MSTTTTTTSSNGTPAKIPVAERRRLATVAHQAMLRSIENELAELNLEMEYVDAVVEIREQTDADLAQIEESRASRRSASPEDVTRIRGAAAELQLADDWNSSTVKAMEAIANMVELVDGVKLLLPDQKYRELMENLGNLYMA
tara:strand:+ start:1536 stop:1964 length:429 start_codon:yes stop_codon:yes gene_type:complete